MESDRALVLTLERVDANGAVSVGDYNGRAVLVIAFAMENLPSQAVLRAADDLARTHPADLAVIAVAGDRFEGDAQHELLATYAQALALGHTVFTVADDAVRAGVSPLGVIERVPTTFLVNRAGRLVRRVPGYLTATQLQRLVAPALPPRNP